MVDGPKEEMPDLVLSAPHSLGEHDVKPEDLTAAFSVFLGRSPEDIQQQVTYWTKRPISELLKVIAASDEFANVENALVDYGVLSGGETLSREELFGADAWLARIKAGHVLTPGVGWGDLLLAAVTSKELTDVGGGVLSSEAVETLREVVKTRHSAQAIGIELGSFDAAAFAAAPANRQYCDARGEVDFNATIERDKNAPVMLPLFTEGLAALRQRGPLTIGEWLKETQDAALAGSLTHWLWDESTYRRNRAVSDRGLDGDVPTGLDYLDFLSLGDRAQAAPHPLFCHFAYRTLNSCELTSEDGAFRHFAKSSANVRTSALFDPEFYLSRQPQVRAEITAGRFSSPLEHFVRVGLAAGYDFSPDFDRHFYFASNPDISQNLAEGRILSVEWHYLFVGAREGRAPNPFFNAWYYAARYPVVADEMARLGIGSSLEHFILLGQKRGWLANPPLAERAVAPDDGRALFEKRGRRAYGEIIDGLISIPAADAPRLSVIVPVSNQADFTAGFLKAAAFAIETLRSRRGIETELIVIDSGSRDHTETLLAAMPSVVVAKPSTAFSFPAAVNTGAALARGDVLVIANNDIEFQPDAFDRVFSVLDDDPSIGLVGAKVVLPNETLQEVGASLDRLGNTEGLGRGIDAFRVSGSRRVTVDYASGCFIAFRRADFDALSGFEEAFSPGYYEDVDFALRMKRDLNKTTVVDTGLSVVHYENASFAKGRPVAANMPGVLRNRLLLKTRHPELFRQMTASTIAGRRALARRTAFGGSRVLVIADKVPAAGPGSRLNRLNGILDAFTAMGVAFDILALTPDARIDTHNDPRVQVFRAWIPGQSLQDILPLHGANYSHVWIGVVEILVRHAAVLAQARADFDLKLICDIDALPAQQAAEKMQIENGVVDQGIVLAALAGDLIVPIDVDQWVAVDDQCRALIETIGLGPVSVIGQTSRPLKAVADQTFADRDRILFVGSVSTHDSAVLDGLEWLLSQVWPRLAALGGVKLTVAGDWDKGLAEAFTARFADRVEMIGAVDDALLSKLYSQSRVAVAPDRFAAGRFVKVAEAALAGVPAVMTDLVADRLGVASDPAIAQARRDDGGLSYADWLGRLYTQEKAWRAQLKKQRSIIGSKLEKNAGDVVDQVRSTLDSVNRRV